MGYLYLLCVAILFSFGGTCAKLIGRFFSSEYISCFRFVVGVFFLVLLKLIKRQGFSRDFRQQLRSCGGWIIFGAVTKWLAYLTENYGLTHGPSYGNIVTHPAQTIFLTLTSVFLFREKLGAKRIFFILLCMVGVLSISWNGRPLSVFLDDNVLLLGLFILTGIFAGCHVLAQKMIADRMDSIDSNLAIFAVAALLSSLFLVPDIASGGVAGIQPDLPCILAILAFGFITGIGFYLNAKAIPLVPFFMVPVIQSTMAVFSIIWGVLFFHEQISIYIIGGTAVFLVGLIGLQVTKAKA